MGGKNRFYCIECGHFLDRRCVMTSDTDYRFYCEYCSSPVIKVDKIRLAMVKDYIDYAIRSGMDMEDFQ